MTPYANRGGDSNVLAYEIGGDWIAIQFALGPPYTYSYRSAGVAHVEAMKRLALRGEGLNAYVNTHVKYRYES